MSTWNCPDCGAGLSETGAIAFHVAAHANHQESTATVTRTQDPDTMPAAVHGEEVVSAFRHLPLLGRLDYTYTVITRDGSSPVTEPRYCVSRARFAPLLGRWSIDTNYPVTCDLNWTEAAGTFAGRVTIRAS